MVTFWELELHRNCSQNKQEERDAMDELHPNLLREFTYGKLRLVDLLVGVTVCLRFRKMLKFEGEVDARMWRGRRALDDVLGG